MRPKTIEPSRVRIVSQATLVVGAQILLAAVLFVTTPYIALGLGAERYGLYTLLFLFLGYSTALDFGLSFALVKQVAEHDPETERTEIDALTSTATTVYASLAAAFVVALVFGRGWIARTLLHAPADLVPVTEDAVLLVACAVPFATASTVFNALFRGLLRFEYVALFTVVNASAYAIGAAVLVSNGASLSAVIGLYAGVTAASALSQWAILHRLLPGFRPVPRFDVRRLRQLFGFGSFMAMNQVANIALLQLDRLVIGRVLSVAMAGYYAVPLAISQRLNLLGAATATVAFPHSSASMARGEVDDFRREHLQSARAVAWLTLAPTLAVMVLADLILAYWMSPEFAMHGTLVLRLLAFGILWISVASLDAVSIEGSGHPWVTSLFMVITGVANIVGLLVLTPRLGLGGAAASVTLSLLALASLDVWYCSKNVTRSPVRVWVRAVVLPTVWTTLVSLPITLLLRKAATGLPSLVIVTFAATGCTVVVGYWFFLSAAERAWVRARAVMLWGRHVAARGG
jgi:O-antigen/teichoic acid export membrane protein